jgi:hypothetical protein
MLSHRQKNAQHAHSAYFAEGWVIFEIFHDGCVIGKKIAGGCVIDKTYFVKNLSKIQIFFTIVEPLLKLFPKS